MTAHKNTNFWERGGMESDNEEPHYIYFVHEFTSGILAKFTRAFTKTIS